MPRKKQQTIDKKYELSRHDYNVSLLPVIQNLTAQGYSIADIGLLIGFGGRQPKSWMERLTNNNPEIKDAIELGKKAADAELIETAVKAATGYWIEEEEIEYDNLPFFPAPDKPFGDAKPMQHKYIAKKKKVKKYFVQPNSQLLFKLLCNRMPEHFSDVRKVEVDKRELKLKADLTEKEIRQFAGNLYEALVGDEEIRPVKLVESKEVDNV